MLSLLLSGGQRVLPLRESEPVLNRALAVVVAFLLGNCALVAVASVLGVWATGSLTGVPALVAAAAAP